VKHCLAQLAALGCVKVNFFGGEPLLRSDIVELVAFAAGKNLFVFIDTNGLLLSRRMAAALKNAGASCVLISLDSPNRQRHDASRGAAGCHEKVLAGLENCRGEGLPCVISTMATRRSLADGDLQGVISLSRQLGASGVRVLTPILAGAWRQEQRQLLDAGDMRSLRGLIEPGFVYLESGGTRPSCPAAQRRLIYISPQGDVRACYAVTGNFGNVRAGPLRDIIRRMWRTPISSSRLCQGPGPVSGA
jgi:MoaA/NifB/PqqE/SkfB family radical SAM enzyme